ncbi:MAG: glycosyltransferase family 4 protein [Candidatus Nanopelagicales bacterium]
MTTSKVLRLLFLNWRDTRHPEGGGSEVYVENVARSLAAAGHHVTVFCAMYEGALPRETVDGVHFVRAGTKLGVYGEAVRRVRRREFGRLDAIVDVQNGIPFMSRAVAGETPVVVLVHHVHREQWPVVYDRLRSRIGWWIESVLAPRLYRDCTYVAVSHKTRDELDQLGVSAHRVRVIHNGIEQAPGLDVGRSPHPHIAVVGRLVPHKRVEHVLRAAAILRRDHPDLRISVVGDGWWSPRLRRVADTLAVSDMVDFLGFVDEKTKHRVYASAWLLALPSLKEGWGIVVMEAATHSVPTVAYRDAGGVAESIVDGRTGVLVDGGVEQFAQALGHLLSQETTRNEMGQAAQQRAEYFTWAATTKEFADVLTEVAGGSTNGEVSVVPAPSGHVEHQAHGAPTDQASP